jgi:outer membrane protein assembly factor BamB
MPSETGTRKKMLAKIWASGAGLVFGLALIAAIGAGAFPAWAAGGPTLTITHPTPAFDRRLGSSAAGVDGNVLVGAVGVDSANGAGYLFNGTTGTLLREFLNPSPNLTVGGDQFGTSVAGAMGKILVGAPLDDDTTVTDAGAAYFYTFDGMTMTWSSPLTIPNPNPIASADNFGTSVAIVGGNFLVGAPLFDDAGPLVDSGAAYLFDAVTGALLRTFSNPTPAGGDQFGFAVAAMIILLLHPGG